MSVRRRAVRERIERAARLAASSRAMDEGMYAMRESVCQQHGRDPREDCPWKCALNSEWCACRDRGHTQHQAASGCRCVDQGAGHVLVNDYCPFHGTKY